jgi:hypothetical protein
MRRATGTLVVALLLLAAPAANAGVPAPPRVTYIHARPPGMETDPTFRAGADGETIYYVGRLDPFVRNHELGHVFDDELLNDGDRHFFTRMMGLRGPWVQAPTEVLGALQGGDRSPNEWFADWYANARLGNDPARAWVYGYADMPSARTFHQFIAAVTRVYHRRMGARATRAPHARSSRYGQDRNRRYGTGCLSGCGRARAAGARRAHRRPPTRRAR